jgi:hypothetical protein
MQDAIYSASSRSFIFNDANDLPSVHPRNSPAREHRKIALALTLLVYVERDIRFLRVFAELIVAANCLNHRDRLVRQVLWVECEQFQVVLIDLVKHIIARLQDIPALFQFEWDINRKVQALWIGPIANAVIVINVTIMKTTIMFF